MTRPGFLRSKWHHTKMALYEFDRGQPARQRNWDRCASQIGMVRAARSDFNALQKVRIAFHKDTKHINSLADCMMVDIEFMRRMANTMTDYTALDTQILESIRTFPGGTFQDIYAGRVQVEANKIEPTRADRITHQRIKELSKQDLIFQKSRGWYPK